MYSAVHCNALYCFFAGMPSDYTSSITITLDDVSLMGSTTITVIDDNELELSETITVTVMDTNDSPFDVMGVSGMDSVTISITDNEGKLSLCIRCQLSSNVEDSRALSLSP